MGVDRRRPKKRWFAVAIVLPELAVVLAIVYRALSLLTFADTVDRFDRFTSVGELAQPFDRGDVHIDAELDSVETSAATDPPSIP